MLFLPAVGTALLPAAGPLFYFLQWACSVAVPIDHPVSSTWSSSSVSSLLLATLPCELFHAFSSARSSRAVSQHAPSRAARGDRSRAWLLWISRSCRQPALVRSCWGPECGRDRLVPRVHDVILPWQTHCEGERSCFACSVSASGRHPPPRLCCCDSPHLLPLRSFRLRALCVDEAVLDFVRGPFDETSRPQPFVISSFLDALCHRRHHLEHLVICLRSQACDELPRNGECI